MAARASKAAAALRRLGPRRFARRAVEIAGVRLRGSWRARWLRVRPLRVSPEEVAAALGGLKPAAALRGPVLDAMPTVRAFESAFAAGGNRGGLLERADAIVAHRFDLLGSGPVELGPEIDWQLDFKSGRRWPLAHISRVPIVYPDGSDIKVPWELGRCQHLPVLAAAARVSGERRYRDEIRAQLDSWIAANPVEFGAGWACTMDVAIRAANWLAALALIAEDAAGEPWLERAVASLLLHGRFIRSHLETYDVRGNHYLADVVGLAAVAALFARGAEGRAWAEFAAAELATEMDHQVHADGVDHEASIPYHRLVSELFVCGTQAIDALLPGRLGPRYRDRLVRMLGFTADYTRPDGLAPQIGDADDGRYLPLDDYARADVRSHTHLFSQSGVSAPPPSRAAAYRDGGYYVLRAGELYTLVRCGSTGMRGRGGHGHNDQLAFELCACSQPLVVDPGAYAYTGDPEARNLFRSTRYHATLAVDDQEQNEFPTDSLFSLPDQTRAELVEWSGDGVFEGIHHGYERLAAPATHRRRIELDEERARLEIVDTIESRGRHELEWSFPLAPGADVRAGSEEVAVRAGSATLEMSARGVEFSVAEGWYSPAYGRRVRAPHVRARRAFRPGDAPTRFVLTVG